MMNGAVKARVATQGDHFIAIASAGAAITLLTLAEVARRDSPILNVAK